MFCFLLGATCILVPRYFNLVTLPLHIVAAIFFALAGLLFWSRNSLLNDAEKGLVTFRFTPEGWFRDEKSILYRWEDFKKVEFNDRCITFYNSKKHRIHSASITPMLMTDFDFDRVEKWIKRYIPDSLR